MTSNAVVNPYAYSRAASTIAGKHGLSVRFGEPDQGVQVNGNTITIPAVGTGTTQAMIDKVLTKVDYFGSLWRYGDKDMFNNLKELPADKPLGYMYRLFNDSRVTTEAASEFMGSRRSFSEDTAAETPAITGYIGELDPKQQAVLAASLKSEQAWNSGVSMADIESGMSPEGKTMLAKLESEQVPGMIAALKNGSDPLAVAKYAYQLLWEDDPDQQEQKERQQQQQGQGEDGEGGGGENGEGDGGGKMDPKANPKNQSHAETKIGTGGDSDGDEIQANLRMQVDHDCRRPYTLESGVVYKQAKDLEASRYDVLKDWCGYRQGLTLQEDASSAVFANRIRRHIQAMAAADWIHSQKRGKLSGKNVHRIALPSSIATARNDRVFKRKIESDVLDTAIYVMIDMSGSMSGPETVYTYKATCLLAHAFQVLGIPTQVSAFSSLRKTEVYALKNWNERVTSDILLDRYNRVVDSMCQNNDSAALLFAYDELTLRPEKRKILIMQSDGQPADGGITGNPNLALKDSVQRIYREGRVDLLGVGIGHGGLTIDNYYTKDYAKIEDVSRLETQLFELISKRIVE
jgi:hypothetical protein